MIKQLLLTLLLTALMAIASPMRIIQGGSRFVSAIHVPHPTTAGKKVPPQYLHLLQDESPSDVQISTSNTSPRPIRIAKKKSLEVQAIATETNSHSDSSRGSSYQSSARSSPQRTEKIESSSKRYKVSTNQAVEAANAQIIDYEAVLKVPFLPFQTFSSKTNSEQTAHPTKKAKTQVEDLSVEEMERIKIQNRNHYHRKFGRAEEVLPLPPSWPSPEQRHQRKEQIQRVVAEHMEQIEAIFAERNADYFAFQKMSVDERSNDKVRELYEKKQAEYQAEIDRIKRIKGRIMATERMATLREKMRLERGLPLRGVGRPRISDITAQQLKAREVKLNIKKDNRSKNGVVIGVEQSASPVSTITKGNVKLAQCNWSARKRGLRVKRINFDAFIVPGMYKQPYAARLERRPRVPPSADPWIERKRLQQRNRHALRGRLSEPLPPRSLIPIKQRMAAMFQ